MSDIPQPSRRGIGVGMSVEGKCTQHGKPRRWWRVATKPDAREGQAGPVGVAEGPVVPRKPGNAGRGKGLWFKVSVRSSESREIGDEPTNSEEG